MRKLHVLSIVFIMMVLLSGQGEVSASEENFAQQLERAKKIAELKEITANADESKELDIYRLNTNVEGSPESGIVITYESAGASRTNYKIILPVTRVTPDSIFIDCSYVRANDRLERGVISVGGACLGERKAGRDSVENAMDGLQLIDYSPAAPWLKKVRKSVDCKWPLGLTYSDMYFVRCQDENREFDDEEYITITVLSSDFKKMFTISGYEFAPIMPVKNAQKLTFWKSIRDSAHEIMEVDISQAASPDGFIKVDNYLVGRWVVSKVFINDDEGKRSSKLFERELS